MVEQGESPGMIDHSTSRHLELHFMYFRFQTVTSFWDIVFVGFEELTIQSHTC